MAFPEHLYKYESFSLQALENLKNQTIYFGSPSRFNDRYDCAVFPSVKEPNEADLSALREHFLGREKLGAEMRLKFETLDPAGLKLMLLRQGQNVLDKAVQAFLRKAGVACFSERKDSLLMWGHYGGLFKGFSLEFRTDSDPLSKARKVVYAQELPQVDLLPLLCETPESDVVDNLFCTKALDWCYEREWRCLHKDAGTAYTYDSSALTGVYLGPEASFASFEIIALILVGQNPNVQLWQGHRSRSDFSVVFEPVTYTSHAEAKKLGLLSKKPRADE
jgi:hypothetical protein